MRIFLLAILFSLAVILGGCASGAVNMEAKEVSAVDVSLQGSIVWMVANPPMDQHIDFLFDDGYGYGYEFSSTPPGFSESLTIEEAVYKLWGTRDGYVVTPVWAGAPYIEIEWDGLYPGLNFIVTDE